MITCVAVRYHELIFSKLTPPYNHGDIINNLGMVSNLFSIKHTDFEYGFLDNEDNFLTREEATEHAKSCDQLKDQSLDRPLNSFDLKNSRMSL